MSNSSKSISSSPQPMQINDPMAQVTHHHSQATPASSSSLTPPSTSSASFGIAGALLSVVGSEKDFVNSTVAANNKEERELMFPERTAPYINLSLAREVNALFIGPTGAGKTSVIHNLTLLGSPGSVSPTPDNWENSVVGPILYFDRINRTFVNMKFIDTPGVGDHLKNPKQLFNDLKYFLISSAIPIHIIFVVVAMNTKDAKDTQRDLKYYAKNLVALGFRRDQFRFVINRTETHTEGQVRNFWDRIKSEAGVREILSYNDRLPMQVAANGHNNRTEYTPGVALVRGSCDDAEYLRHLPRITKTVETILGDLAHAPGVGVVIPIPAFSMLKYANRYAFDKKLAWVCLIAMLIAFISVLLFEISPQFASTLTKWVGELFRKVNPLLILNFLK